MAEAEARWAPDPFGRWELRWWNGLTWTEHVASPGLQGIDPPVAAPPPPLATPRPPKRDRVKVPVNRPPRDPQRPQAFDIEGAAKHEVHVAGTSFHQEGLLALCGGRGVNGCHLRCNAVLVPNPLNAYDANAVEVRIDGRLVGHLPKDVAAVVAEPLQALERAGLRYRATGLIVGGWDRGDGDVGTFGVRVFLAGPDELREVVETLTEQA